MLYSIFRIRWGWFGLLGNERGLIRTCLPAAGKKAAEASLLKGLDHVNRDPSFFKPFQQLITSYYEGSYVDFKSVPICLIGLTDFQQKVLSALRNVRYGEIITYKQLAEKSGRPKTVRAIGRVLARNPLPLIIPCHRVIRTDGSLGGFSGQGGIEMKKKMLALESATVS